MPWKIGAVSVAIIFAIVMIGGCGSQPQGSGGSQETDAKAQYNETKQMVLDILHTKEGMDTLKDIVRDPQFKRSLAINETDVQVAMLKALTDGSAHATLEEQMRNPKFASALAKSFKKDNESVLKELLRDPEYQEMMLVLLKSPEFTQNLYDLMKTPEYRKQTMAIMTQSLQNPEFKLLYLDLLKQAIREGTTELTPNEKKKAGIESEGGGKEGEKKKEGEGEEKKKEGEGDSSGGEEEGGGGEGGEGGSEKQQGGEGGGGGGGS
ncbi:spore germination lipoprotein GerD [Tumebacillus avium]|uniref:spore germination lipoprotein GerD n=1 Tax=Tumebacillus avium TaxID=1903704 RepID=UPI001E60D34F|nr:spore germination lipoprotein GerD [Tumebacillus avium]